MHRNAGICPSGISTRAHCALNLRAHCALNLLPYLLFVLKWQVTT